MRGCTLGARRASALIRRLGKRVGVSFSTINNLKTMESKQLAKEVKFPVPWGHIAGKEWGDPSGSPVLAVHGWLDNAGSFDELIPLFSKSLRVVAIDLPGHGLSSHRPHGTMYHTHDYVADVKFVVDALKWERFSFLAHSMGAGVATWFSGALPDMVECVVLFEGLGFWPTRTEELPSRMGVALKKLDFLSQTDTKVYPTWESVVDRIQDGHMSLDRAFTTEAAATLAHRGTQRTESGYKFSRDLRVKAPSLLRTSPSVNLEFIKAMQCPVLLILSSSSLLSPSRAEDSIVPEELLSSALSALSSDQIERVRVPGGHHAHMYQPEAMARLVNQFLRTKTIHSDYQTSTVNKL